MTTEVLGVALVVNGIAIPLGEREAVLADLTRRAEVAFAVAEKAEKARDWNKFRDAMERYHLRLLQAAWVEKRPDGARCWKCGELEDGHALSVECLEHRSKFLTERARELAARDCEGLAE